MVTSNSNRTAIFEFYCNTPRPPPPWGLLNSQGKMSNFQKFSGLRPRGKFSTEKVRKPTGETTEPTGDDMKIQQGELRNILR